MMPNQSEAQGYYDCGENLLNKGEYSKSIEEFQKAIYLDPNFSKAYTGIAEALQYLGRNDKAITFYSYIAENLNTDHGQAYSGIGDALYNEGNYEQALEAYKKSLTYFESAEDSEKCFDTYLAIGNTYEALGKYEKSISSSEKAITIGERFPYAYHNIAGIRWKQGNYDIARQYWKKAYKFYDKGIDEARENQWLGHFINFGNLLHEIFGELKKAEAIYKMGLDMNSNNPGIWIGLVYLYLEWSESVPKERVTAYQKAKEAFQKAEELLKKRIRHPNAFEHQLILGELYIKMKEYKKAEDILQKAMETNKQSMNSRYLLSAKAYTDKGVLLMRKKQFSEAIASFEEALKIEPDDLSLRSNLAESYLRNNMLTEAETEFIDVLSTSPEHLESRIGLGELYTVYGDNGEPDMYSLAISHFSEAIRIARLNKGSKRLKKKEFATILYSRAYATVKLYEVSKVTNNRDSIYIARDDFKSCLQSDPDLHKAKRALEKINNLLPKTISHRLMEKIGPSLIFIFSLTVFCLSQLALVLYFLDLSKIPLLEILDKSKVLDLNHYIAITFGSLIMMIASLYLPQVIKIKIVGMELEKSAIDQASTLGTLGISRY